MYSRHGNAILKERIIISRARNIISSERNIISRERNNISMKRLFRGNKIFFQGKNYYLRERDIISRERNTTHYFTTHYCPFRASVQRDRRQTQIKDSKHVGCRHTCSSRGAVGRKTGVRWRKDSDSVPGFLHPIFYIRPHTTMGVGPFTRISVTFKSSSVRISTQGNFNILIVSYLSSTVVLIN